MNKVCKTCGGYDICIMGHAGRTAECPEWRPKWIPVSERLPKDDEGAVLVWADEAIEIGWYNTHNGMWVGDDMTVYADGDVTYWMPLPEPPKEVIDIEQIEVE